MLVEEDKYWTTNLIPLSSWIELWYLEETENRSSMQQATPKSQRKQV